MRTQTITRLSTRNEELETLEETINKILKNPCGITIKKEDENLRDEIGAQIILNPEEEPLYKKIYFYSEQKGYFPLSITISSLRERGFEMVGEFEYEVDEDKIISINIFGQLNPNKKREEEIYLAFDKIPVGYGERIESLAKKLNVSPMKIIDFADKYDIGQVGVGRERLTNMEGVLVRIEITEKKFKEEMALRESKQKTPIEQYTYLCTCPDYKDEVAKVIEEIKGTLSKNNHLIPYLKILQENLLDIQKSSFEVEGENKDQVIEDLKNLVNGYTVREPLRLVLKSNSSKLVMTYKTQPEYVENLNLILDKIPNNKSYYNPLVKQIIKKGAITFKQIGECAKEQGVDEKVFLGYLRNLFQGTQINIKNKGRHPTKLGTPFSDDERSLVSKLKPNYNT